MAGLLIILGFVAELNSNFHWWSVTIPDLQADVVLLTALAIVAIARKKSV